MNRYRLVLLALVSAACLNATAAFTAGKPDASDRLFGEGVIPHIRIEIARTNFETLRRNDRAYVPCTVREGTNVWEEVGIHKKGAAGSNRDLNDHPALTLNFDKFIDRQKFHGLDKLHLNNSVQDGTLLCEAICAQLFLDAGIPATRVTHARVEFNGKDLGLYVLKEGFDKTFLKRHFKNASGNLYDGGFLRDVTEPLERDSGTGDVKNHADLKALVAAANDPDPANRFARLEKILDLPRFLDLCALEILTWHWDGYAMKHNNYRVYHDPDTDRMHFFPHGMDQMFWRPDGEIIPNDREGLIYRRLVETPQGRSALRQHQSALLTNVFTAGKLTNHIALIQARLQPALAKISQDKAREQSNAAHNLRSSILARVKYLDRRLNQPPPPVLQFDANGFAALTKWEIPDSTAPPTATLARVADPGGIQALHIAALPDKKCIGSWRTQVMLDPGSYILEGRARTAGVIALTNDVTPVKGIGAGIRLSRATEPRKHQLAGDSGWTKLEYEFPVTSGPDEITLICELRAAAGEAWFDLNSLRLRKK